MSHDFEFHRRSIRLGGCDYSQPGMYFVTICTKEREPVFGNIADGVMVVNDIGKIVDATWCEIPRYYENVSIDEYQIMPDHFHGIILINEPRVPVGAGPCARPHPDASRAHPRFRYATMPQEGQPQGVAPTCARHAQQLDGERPLQTWQ